VTGTWDDLTRNHGKKAVMSLTISDKVLEAETNRQIPLLRSAIRPLLTGHERTALDFGCGYGRFTPMLANLIDGRAVGFDPCAEMLRAGHGHLSVDYVSCPTGQFFQELRATETRFDLILAFAVLGEPSVPVWITALELCNVLSPEGLMVIVEHVVPHPDPGRWWRFRPPGFYEEVFAACGVHLHEVGTVPQLDDTMTILAGSLSPPPA
jgi:SAM-dependent methyltransferase